MSIQPNDYDPAMNAPSGKTVGGNEQIINGDEGDTPAASYNLTPMQMAPGSESYHPGGG